MMQPQPLLRNDGHWLIYRVEVFHKYNSRSEWVDAGGDEEILKAVPSHVRYWTIQAQHEVAKNEPFRAFSTIGDCWQQTGINGTFDKQQAIALMHVLAKYHRGKKFRVVAHLVSQLRVPLEEYSAKPKGRTKREKPSETRHA